jgi:hypothetical protein
MIDIAKVREAINGIHNKQKGYDIIKEAVEELERLQKKVTIYYNALCDIETTYGDDDFIRKILEKVFT